RLRLGEPYRGSAARHGIKWDQVGLLFLRSLTDELRDFGVFFAQALESCFVSLNLRQIHVQLGDADLTTLRGNKKQGALGKIVGLPVDLEVTTLFPRSFPLPCNLLALGRGKGTPCVRSEQP